MQAAAPRVMAAGDAQYFSGLNDPRLIEFLREGRETASGITVSTKEALKNTTVVRCVSLISFAIGMLPLHLQFKESKEKAEDHPLFRVLHRRPNAWQTAFEFRSLMQQWALGANRDGCRGDAFAYIIRSRGQIRQLVPIPTDRVRPKQRADWTLEYEYQRPDGSTITLPQRDIFHLRYGLSEDGISGLSLVRQAAEAIGLAQQTERAAARLFKNGMMVGGALAHPGKLSPEAYERLKASMEEREGADMAHKWLITEEGMEAKPFAQTGRDSQNIEQRRHQIEEIARPFGVPRPLLGVDDTSWGSGIDVLGQFFVRYALNPWFEAWQQAIERSLLTEEEAEIYEAKFNAGALLRGSMKDQAEFFAKGLGAGGHQPFLEVAEVRDWLDLPRDANLPPPPGGNPGDTDDDDSQAA